MTPTNLVFRGIIKPLFFFVLWSPTQRPKSVISFPETEVLLQTYVSGAKPKPEGRVRERGWWPTRRGHGIGEARSEAARPRAIEAADNATVKYT